MRRTKHPRLAWIALAVAPAAMAGSSCESQQPEARPYFDREIAPILDHSCSRQTTGCHVTNARGQAVGNLDTSSFDGLDRRRDLLAPYGPYATPLLLAKVIGPQTVTVSTLDGPVPITTDIRHAAGSGIDLTSEGFAVLRRWMDTGAARDGMDHGSTKGTPTGPCREVVPGDPAFDPSVEPPAFDEFVHDVQPVLRASCSAASCHGSANADLALTCGDDDTQKRWNAFVAAQFLAAPPERSELLLRSLDPRAGGVYHEGGAIFSDRNDPGWQALAKWAAARGPATIDASEELRFFANRVQPMLVRKGCMFVGCHSPSMFHEYTLRGGTNGDFSVVATKKNYALSKSFLALESSDPNASRLISKNLFPFDRAIDDHGLGIRHRGGALFEDVDPTFARATPAACAGVDVEKGDLSTIPSYCVLAAWHAKERASATAKGPAAGGVAKDAISAIVYVSRPPDDDVPQAFDRYRPGASLHVVDASLGADGTVTLGTDHDVTAACGLVASTADIRRPAVSWGGARVAFAARTSDAEPLAIYVMTVDGKACAEQPAISDHPATSNGILVHDFDPAWAPDGRLVFASTRGAIGQNDVDYSGATRTPDGFWPNANLYVLDDATSIRQLTFLLGQEIAPAFKHDGRLILTSEKRAPDFYQLAGRRLNLDGTDYHPLFGQRKSIGFDQFIDVRELADGNLVGIFSQRGAKARGGALGVINRSLGPDQDDRDPSDRFFLHSLSFPDAAASGAPGTTGNAYRTPSPLPNGTILASFAQNVDLATFDGTWSLVQLDDKNGTRHALVDGKSGVSIVDAVAVYARPNRGVFVPSPYSFQVEAGAHDAELRSIDVPMIASILFDNRRLPHALDVTMQGLGILESLPPPTSATSLDAVDPAHVVTDSIGSFYFRRRRLGVAPLFDDGSAAIRIPGGVPLVYEFWDDSGSGAPAKTLLEEIQFAPGERAKGSFRRALFDANCGGCHGSVSGLEVDVHVRPDVLTSASEAKAATSAAIDLFLAPSDRGGEVKP